MHVKVFVFKLGNCELVEEEETKVTLLWMDIHCSSFLAKYIKPEEIAKYRQDASFSLVELAEKKTLKLWES